jgi:hypothetical protein
MRARALASIISKEVKLDLGQKLTAPQAEHLLKALRTILTTSVYMYQGVVLPGVVLYQLRWYKGLKMHNRKVNGVVKQYGTRGKSERGVVKAYSLLGLFE